MRILKSRFLSWNLSLKMLLGIEKRKQLLEILKELAQNLE